MMRRLRPKRSGMMWSLAALLVFCLAVLNFPATFLGNQHMDWLLLLPWVAGYFYGESDGVKVGICCGLLRDLLFARYFGTGMLICMLTGLLSAKFFAKQFDRRFRAFPLQFVLLWLLKDVFYICLGVLRKGLVGFNYQDYIRVILSHLPVGIFINLVAAVLLAILVRFVLRPRPFTPFSETEYEEEFTAI